MLHSEDQRVAGHQICSPFFICLLHCAFTGTCKRTNYTIHIKYTTNYLVRQLNH
jgi:hypothetical protein